MIQVVKVPAPAVGHDWTFTIPGQWNVALLAVTATIGTTTTLSQLPDETGNGRPIILAPFGNQYTLGAQGPYAGGANNYATRYVSGLTTPNQLGDTNDFAAFGGAAGGGWDGWLFIRSGEAMLDSGSFLGSISGGSTNWGFGMPQTIGSPATVRHLSPAGGFQDTAGVMPLNQWFHFAAMWDGAHWQYYVNGANTATGDTHGPAIAGACHIEITGGVSITKFNGSEAGFAVYSSAISGAAIAAHAAAGGNWLTYRAAVLADSPAALWGLNTIPTMATRTVDLKLTDGTFTVGDYPAAFASATVSSATWCWQVLGSGALGSSDGTVNAVPIPEMYLPPGYTVGTRTLDLAATDQWQNITLYLDDGTGNVPPWVSGGNAGSAELNVLILG